MKSLKPFIFARLKAFIAAPSPTVIVAALKLAGVDITPDQALAIIGIVTPVLVHWVPNIKPSPVAPKPYRSPVPVSRVMCPRPHRPRFGGVAVGSCGSDGPN